MVFPIAVAGNTQVTHARLSDCTQVQTDQVACDISDIEAGLKAPIYGGDTIALTCDTMPSVADTPCEITFNGQGTGEALVISDPGRIEFSNCGMPTIFYFREAARPDAQFSLECTIDDVGVARSLQAVQLEEPEWGLEMPMLASPSELGIHPIPQSGAMRLTSCVASETERLTCTLEAVGERIYIEEWWLRGGDEMVLTQIDGGSVGSFVRIEPASLQESAVSEDSRYLVGEGDQITLDGCAQELATGKDEVRCTFLEVIPAFRDFGLSMPIEGETYYTLLPGSEVLLWSIELWEYPSLSADSVFTSTDSMVATIVDGKSHTSDGTVWRHVELDDYGINGWIPQDFIIAPVKDESEINQEEFDGSELGSLSITGYLCPDATSADEACMEAGPVEILNATLRLEDGQTMQLAPDMRQEDGSYAWLNIPIGEYVLLADGLLGPDGSSARDVVGASGQADDGWIISNTNSYQPAVLQVFFVPAGEVESPD
jgi:hypothetical protein